MSAGGRASLTTPLVPLARTRAVGVFAPGWWNILGARRVAAPPGLVCSPWCHGSASLSLGGAEPLAYFEVMRASLSVARSSRLSCSPRASFAAAASSMTIRFRQAA